MADIFTKAERSAVMARIRGSGNRATELRLIALMRAHGITGWRRGSRLPGRPDFVFAARRLAVFVDGCFWHGCPTHFSRPKSRRAFWDAKIAANRERDRRVSRRIARPWVEGAAHLEHALRPVSAARAVSRLRRAGDWA